MSSQEDALPVFFSGKVIHGAGRGGTQLGFPTANVDASSIQGEIKRLQDGVYFGYARVVGGDGHAEPMVMSIGQNVTFDATHKTVEVHILKEYPADFYGSTIQVAIVGYIRGMVKFDGIDSLIEGIKNDIKIAREKFTEPEISKHSQNEIFANCPSS